jgi:hypothetical protein
LVIIKVVQSVLGFASPYDFSFQVASHLFEIGCDTQLKVNNPYKKQNNIVENGESYTILLL